MNALRASSSCGCLEPILKNTIGSNTADLVDQDLDVIDEASLDDLSIGANSQIQEDTDNNSRTNEHSDRNGVESIGKGATQLDSSQKTIKFAQDLLKPYLCGKEQPTTTLQRHYADYQYKQNKQSEVKSIKPWFHYSERRGDNKDLWWSAYVSVPNNVANHWGFRVKDDEYLDIDSGYLPLSLKEWDIVESTLGETDLLRRLFGEYKQQYVTSEGGSEMKTLWFKTKSAAQKSATINLLFHMNGDKHIEVETKPKTRKPQKSECVQLKLYLSSVNRLNLSFGGESSRHTLCEKALPRWSTDEIGSKGFLFELKFTTNNDLSAGNEREPPAVPLSYRYGLENESTRIGLFTASDVFEGLDNEVIKLSADFTIPGSKVFRGPITVTVCKRTSIDISDLMPQHELDAVSIIKCFNAILFENGGRTYGMKPATNVQEILSEIRNKQSYFDRTYMLVPLKQDAPIDKQELSIDWKVILDVVNNTTTPVLQRFNISLFFYQRLLGVIIGALVIEIALCYLLSSNEFSGLESGFMCTAQSYNIAGCFFLTPVIGFSLIILVAVDKYTPPRRVSRSTLLNRFMKQPVGFKGNLFILEASEANCSLTAISPLLPAETVFSIPEEVKQSFYDRYNINIGEATVASYYNAWMNYGNESDKEKLCNSFTKTALKCARESLIKVKNRLSKLCNSFTKKTPKYEHESLIKVQSVLSLAASMLCNCFTKTTLKYEYESLLKVQKILSHAASDFTICSFHSKKIGSINRHELSISQILIHQGYLVPQLVVILPMPRDLLYQAQHSPRFMTALEHAYTLKVAAVRLLHLQAKSLVHTPILSSMRINRLQCLLKLVTKRDGQARTVREEERLEILGDVVLQFLIVINFFSGLSNRKDNVLDACKDEVTWLGRNKLLEVSAKLLGLHLLCLDNDNAISSWRSAYMTKPASCSNTMQMKRLSNMFESLLGVAFLSDSSGAIAAGILNESMPFREQIEDDAAASMIWFKSVSTCMDEGYTFEKDISWATSLNQINTILENDSLVLPKLNIGAQRLFDILLKYSRRSDLMDKIKAQKRSLLLVHAALFDSSLKEMEELNKHENLAILRDKLFHVGHATLYLSVVNEIYHQYPYATSGDIHFAKLYILSDDILAYILIKNSIHECLFDEDSEASSAFTQYMSAADSLGREFWECHSSRLQERNMGEAFYEIRYPGLAAGRLFGEKRAIDKDITDELTFSMKVIVGALSLSIGCKDAWTLVRPLFLELLLLSPDEMRSTFNGVSHLAAMSKKGSH